MKFPIFLRVDHPRLREIVESFDKEISTDELEDFNRIASDLKLGHIGYVNCMEGSKTYEECSNDPRYVKKIHEVY